MKAAWKRARTWFRLGARAEPAAGRLPAQSPRWADLDGTGYRRLDLSLRTLSARERPYALRRPASFRIKGATDDDDVATFIVNGTAHYHPVRIAQQALSDLEGYRHSGNVASLERAQRSVDRVLEHVARARDGIYYPYEFDFALADDPDDMMKAPWYSAMAQGQMLSALVRLHATTGDDRYREAAMATFQTFVNERSGGDPWTVFVDDGYLWLEEYAKDPPMRVLNGHIFGMFGLYDYHQLTGDGTAANLFEGAAATVAHYGEQFRDPGTISQYCLRVPTIKNAKYHRIHQDQLRMLTRMTGEPYFASLAHRLRFDYDDRWVNLVRRPRRKLLSILRGIASVRVAPRS